MKRTGSEKQLNKARIAILLLPAFLLCACLLCACGASGTNSESPATSNGGAVSEKDKSEPDGDLSSGEAAAEQTPSSNGGGKETVTQNPGGASYAAAAPSNGGGETVASKPQETAPAAQEPQTPQTPAPAPAPEAKKELTLSVNGQVLSVNWEENESVAALEKLVKEEPLTVAMSMYGGFEQVGSLGTSLPRNDSQTTTSAGDIVLYSGDQLVIFYGSNSWAYTRLGKIDGKSAAELKDLLGSGNVTVTLAQR